MKRLVAVLVAVVVMVFFLVSSVLAGEKEEGWNPTAEVAVGIHGKYLDEASGALYYDKAMSNQSVMVGLDKNGTGLYFQAENFAPFDKEESRETNFYVGFYTEAYYGMKFDVGYAHYWVRESGELDYHAVYAAIDFPTIGWQIIPFIKAEYNFAKGYSEDSMDGFMYYWGFRREFRINEWLSLGVELGSGGNTGVYGLPAEPLAYVRPKSEISISFTERLKLKISALTQWNTGKAEGIAADTDRLFVGAAIVWTF